VKIKIPAKALKAPTGISLILNFILKTVVITIDPSILQNHLFS
jgi:hypothetical protein